MGTGAGADAASTSVVLAVAERMGVEPTEVRPRLDDVVDPDALDRLFPGGDGGRDSPVGRVEFRYCGFDVTVTSDGHVAVTE